MIINEARLRSQQFNPRVSWQCITHLMCFTDGKEVGFREEEEEEEGEARDKGRMGKGRATEKRMLGGERRPRTGRAGGVQSHLLKRSMP